MIAEDRLRAWLRDFGDTAGPAFREDLSALLDEVRRLRGITHTATTALESAEMALGNVLYDEETIRAGLWRGPMVPRTLDKIKAALTRLAGPAHPPAQPPQQQ